MMSRWKLWLVLVALVGLVACGGKEEGGDDTTDGNDSGAAAQSESVDEAMLTSITLEVDGMVCGEACPPRVKEQLASVEGVESCTVDYPTKTAVVKVRKDAHVEPEQLVAALKGDFKGSVKN